MNLIIRPTRLSDLSFCTDCIRDDFLFPGKEERLLAFWSDLLQSGAAVSAVGEDTQETFGCRIVLFGMAVFLPSAFARELKSGLHPYYSRFLLERWEQGNCPILSRDEVRAANSGSGLILLNLHSGGPRALITSDAGRPLRDETANFNYFGVAGYRLNEYLIEAYGPFEKAWGENLGLCPRSDFEERFSRTKSRPPEDQHPMLLGLTRQEALGSEGSAIGRVFAYQTPRFHFKPAEQALLLNALSGMTDRELAPALGIALPTVRQRWDAVYDQVEDAAPDLLLTSDIRRNSDVTRQPKKRPLLQYLRYHMEELRPHH